MSLLSIRKCPRCGELTHRKRCHKCRRGTVIYVEKKPYKAGPITEEDVNIFFGVEDDVETDVC